MKKIKVDFKDLDYATIQALITAYPEGFKDSDVVVFSAIDSELEDRVKLMLDGKVLLIKKSLALDLSDTFDEEYFKFLKENQEGDCDAEYC